MTDTNEIKPLLQKFVQGRCNAQEAEHVVQYCKQHSLTTDFPTVEEVNYLIDNLPEMNAAKADTIFANIMLRASEAETTPEPKVRKLHWRRYTAIAACFALLATSGWFYLQSTQPMVKPMLKLNGTEITLQLENGDIQVITEDGTIQIMDAEGNIVGNQDKTTIAYSKDADVGHLAYNTLKIPYGKRFQLKLSDGTVVHLNAGTTLKYPVKFLAGQERTVYLDGEAFFDVAKDKKHPFIVSANDLNVRVLGTHFNVSNYAEDDNTDVVLVEGSVGLYTANQQFDAGKNTVLKPGYRGRFSKAESEISTKRVATKMYTAWIDGDLIFRDMTFKNICRKLERHYNITIKIPNNKLAAERFNASFKNQSIEKVMSYFHELNGFGYTIKDDTVIIK
ncbi:MAG: FecR domain-containing protein [Bacteroidota bacterium]